MAYGPSGAWRGSTSSCGGGRKMESRPSPEASWARGIQLSGGICTGAWCTCEGLGLGLGEARKGSGCEEDEAEAGTGIGWMSDGVESSCGVYGRERAGSGIAGGGVGVSRAGRDRERWRGVSSLFCRRRIDGASSGWLPRWPNGGTRLGPGGAGVCGEMSGERLPFLALWIVIK